MFNTIAVFLLLFLCSCSDENSIDNENHRDGNISGKWHLISFECCDLPQEEYSHDEIIWTFNDEIKRLTIENKITFDESSEFIFQVSGTYTYSLKDSVLTISYNNRDRKFDLGLENGKMILSQNPESDGPLLEFNR